MSLIKRIFNRTHPSPERVVDESTDRLEAAERAIESAVADLKAARSRAPQVAELVARSATHLELNHFGEMAQASMGSAR